MNKFPWWDKKITVYNKYVDPNTRVVTWYKTTLSDCFWKRIDDTLMANSKVKLGNSVADTRQIICRIPKNSKFKEYSNWSYGDKNRFFTLNQGDIIIKGKITEDIDEYSGLKSTELLNKYKDTSLQIVEVTIDDVTGITLDHYKVIGK